VYLFISTTEKRSVFDEIHPKIGGEVKDHEQEIPRLKRTLSDEMLLTEVGLDSENIEMYDFSALYSDVLRTTCHYKIKAFKNNDTNNFF